jgi:hypothetical protein
VVGRVRDAAEESSGVMKAEQKLSGAVGFRSTLVPSIRGRILYAYISMT